MRRADDKCWSEGQWMYADRMEWMVVISNLVLILSQFRSPMTCWYYLVTCCWVSSGSVDSGITSTGRPVLKNVARGDLLHSVRPYRSIMSITKASWCTKHWISSLVSCHSNFIPKNHSNCLSYDTVYCLFLISFFNSCSTLSETLK